MKMQKFDICLCGPQHGICRAGLTTPDAARLDSSWVGPFPGEAALLCDHIRRSVELATALPSALLIFSGGDTQEKLPGRSEAESAFELARDHIWFGYPAVAERSYREKDARDSAQNLEFSAFLSGD